MKKSLRIVLGILLYVPVQVIGTFMLSLCGLSITLGAWFLILGCFEWVFYRDNRCDETWFLGVEMLYIPIVSPAVLIYEWVSTGKLYFGHES